MKTSVVHLITKIWAVSVIMEPLLLFTFASRIEVGIGLNISRILQAFVVTYLFIKFLSGKSFSLPKRGLFLITPYLVLIFYIFLSTFISIALNSYPVPVEVTESTGYLDLLNSHQVRPIIEFFIVVYQFFYFLILPILLLKKKNDIDFFFKVLFFFLTLHFGLGYLDFLLWPTGFDLIPRHISDGVDVGMRWHGIAGEPRDAAIYGMSLFFVLIVYSIYKYDQVLKLNRIFIAILLLSMILSFSASFVIGVLFSSVLLLFFYLSLKSPSNLARFATAGFVTIVGLVVLINTSERLYNYYSTYSSMILELYQNPYLELPYVVKVSFNNVYPVIFFVKDLFENLNFYSIIFGYGIGASGVINQNIYGEYANPNNQFVRFIVEYGLFGGALLFLIFNRILKRACVLLKPKDTRLLLVASFIMVGGILAHRSNVWLIWFGVLCAVSTYRYRSQQSLIKSVHDDTKIRK